MVASEMVEHFLSPPPFRFLVILSGSKSWSFCTSSLSARLATPVTCFFREDHSLIGETSRGLPLPATLSLPPQAKFHRCYVFDLDSTPAPSKQNRLLAARPDKHIQRCGRVETSEEFGTLNEIRPPFRSVSFQLTRTEFVPNVGPPERNLVNFAER